MAEVGMSFQQSEKVNEILPAGPYLSKMFLMRYSLSMIYISNFNRQKLGSCFLIYSKVRILRFLLCSRSKKVYQTLFLSTLDSSISPVNQSMNSKKLKLIKSFYLEALIQMSLATIVVSYPKVLPHLSTKEFSVSSWSGIPISSLGFFLRLNLILEWFK